MSTLYIRLPSKAAADNASHWIALVCPFALVLNGGEVEREGMAPLSDLSGMVAKSQRVVLLLAASDVTLLRLKMPPLSGARLKAALPNMVEDQLMSDPSECVVVAGDLADGLRTVAVVQRGWLEILVQTMLSFGTGNVAAIPSQLCLPLQPGSAVAAVSAFENGLDLTLRLSEQEGLGLPVMPEQPGSGASDAVQTLCAIVPAAPIVLYVPQASVLAYQQAVAELLPLEQRVTVYADNWSRWIDGARHATLNVAAGLGAGSGGGPDWRRWRWPLMLAGAVLLVNIVGLNVEWLRMKREAAALRTTMLQIYKAAYPKDTVIVDPVAQMRQKIATAQRAAGQAAPDDFAALAATFGETWAVVGQNSSGRKTPGIAAIDYRDRGLQIKLKPDGEPPTQQMKTALAARNLTLTQPSASVWQIRSGK
ncbi:MAG: general secretion pathway protein GspL [Herminiimonas sp.]|nr:general secretion pathway protein GspL [Herminiimonas sp.]